MKRLFVSMIIAIMFSGVTFAGIKEAKQYVKEKKYAEAEAEYRKALPELKGTEAADVQFQIANMLQSQRKYKEAIEEYNKVPMIEGAPQEIISYAIYRTGRCYTYLRQYSEAEAEYRKALPGLTSSRAINTQLWIADMIRYQKKYEEAIEEYNKVIQIKKASPNVIASATNGIGVSLQAMKQYDKAIEEYNKAETMEKVTPNIVYTAVYNKGVCFQSLKQYDTAIAEFRKIENIEKISPSQKSNALFGIGQCYEKLKKIEEAIAEYKKIENMDGISKRRVDLAKSKIEKLSQSK